MSENELVFISPEVQRRGFLEALRERAEDNKAARERAADQAYLRGERETVNFLARMRGDQHVGAVAGAIAQAAVDDAAEEITRTRCHNRVDRWLGEQGGSLGLLEELLGTRAAATRSAMLDSQAALRARFQETERSKSHLERRVDALERENAYLRSQVDRSFEVLAEQGRSAHLSSPPRPTGRCGYWTEDRRQCELKADHVGSHNVERYARS